MQAETRLNNLLVSATPAQHKVVEEVLRVLDVDDGTGKKIPSGSSKPYLEVYTLKQADAREVAKSLGTSFPVWLSMKTGRTTPSTSWRRPSSTSRSAARSRR